MEQLFNIDFKKISSSSEKEALKRKKNFELFLKTGLPNKKDESWKFSDLNFIINKNFNQITNNDDFKFDKKKLNSLMTLITIILFLLTEFLNLVT